MRDPHRMALIAEADKLRHSANLALTLQPFHCDDEAFLFAVHKYVAAAEMYRRVGVGFLAKRCLLEAADCWERLDDRPLAESLREQADRLSVPWEGSDDK